MAMIRQPKNFPETVKQIRRQELPGQALQPPGHLWKLLLLM